MEPLTLRKNVRSAFTVASLTVAVQFITAAVLLLLTRSGALDKASDYTAQFALPQLLYPLFTVLLVVVFLAASETPLRSAVSCRRPRAEEFFPWFGVFLMTSVIMNDVSERLAFLFRESGLPADDAFAPWTPQTTGEWMIYLPVIALLPPVSEELLCRGWVAGQIRRSHPAAAVILSAFVFGLMHANLLQIPFAFGLGLILGAAYVCTENFLYPVIFHFFNNAWACFLLFLAQQQGDRVALITETAGDLIFIAGGCFGAAYLIRKKPRFPHTEEPSEPHPVRAVLGTPSFWIFTILYVGLTVANVAR